MNFTYVPIIAAKKGEFDALSNLLKSTSNRIMPLFEVPNPGFGKAIESSITKGATKAGKAWSNCPAFLDISKWKPNSRTESAIHILEFAFSQYRTNGIMVHPVIAYDRWDDTEYSQALKNIRVGFNITPCIRFDREAIEEMGDLEYFEERIAQIMEELNLSPEDCHVLIDFGDLSKSAIPEILETAESAIDIVQALGFNTVIIAGSSMPTMINGAVNSPDSVGCIPRKEVMVWKAIFEARRDERIIFGDYSIRSANAVEVKMAPHANAKIRYTIDNQFFIVRGHSKKTTRLALQNTELAKILIASNHYMGSSFSWGDSQIFECAIGTKEMGSPTTWIAIDTSHHFQTVVVEVFEYQRQFVRFHTVDLGEGRKIIG